MVDKNVEKVEDVLNTPPLPTQSVVNRPPKPPGPSLGPYLQFLTTDLENMIWIGSVLLFRHISFDQPTIKFMAQVDVKFDWEILYDNLFGMRAYRINLHIDLPQGKDDEKITWHIDWGDKTSEGSFYIAQYDQKWRGAFFSCNGFDATVSKEVAAGLTYQTVWEHLLSEHQKTPFHLLLWGGDQNYNDFVLEDTSFLQTWSNLSWEEKWTIQMPDDAIREIEEYYFNNYVEHWECRPEMKEALASVPGLMMWDDHDIYDGAGSYPPFMNQSPVITKLFSIAQQMRLLFQHHTTPDKARQHRLFGDRGHNFLARCGPHLALLGADGRTERSDTTVQAQETWDIIFEKLNSDIDHVDHLIVLFPVPFSFVRFKIAENLLETWKRLSMRWRNIPFSEKTNSVFGLPEMYDDLLDEWTHEAHLGERNNVLRRFQDYAEKKRSRVSFFSGDVHCCGVGRFRTRDNRRLTPVNDSKWMYQVISSAIVNRPPPKIVIRAAHVFGTRWYPVENTEEAFVDFFQRPPESSRNLFLKKLLPNRNWCCFEQSSEIEPIPQNHIFQQEFYESLFWSFLGFILSLVGLNWILNKQERSSSLLSATDEPEHHLKVRFWLENNGKKNHRPPFANYDLFIPGLK